MQNKRSVKLSLMRKYLLFFLFATAGLNAMPQAPSLLEEPQHLLINNRILAKVNGKTISLIDVVKKMDVFLNRAYPQYANNKVACYQFYTSQWRNTLNQMIDNELILADAAGIELEIPDGEVRETLIERFGPNVMPNLEKIGITYEEAKQMIQTELVVERMNWYRVNSKAILGVNPKHIRMAYKEYCEKNPPEEEWKYQVLSLRAKQETQLIPVVEKAQSLLTAAVDSLENVYETLKSEENLDPSIQLTLSPVYEVSGKSLSASHKETLATLKPGEITAPLVQTTKDKSSLYRVYYLKEHTKKEVPTFEKVADQLHQQLVDEAITKETASYVSRLRQKFTFDEKYFQLLIPNDFQPFSLK